MFDRMVETVGTVALAIVGVAVIAVLVSRNSQTPSVVSSVGGSFAEDLNAAEGPVLGAAEQPGYSLQY